MTIGYSEFFIDKLQVFWYTKRLHWYIGVDVSVNLITSITIRQTNFGYGSIKS